MLASVANSLCSPYARLGPFGPHRFEELQFADAASYMENGRVVFTGTPDEAKAYMRKLGAPV